MIGAQYAGQMVRYIKPKIIRGWKFWIVSAAGILLPLVLSNGLMTSDDPETAVNYGAAHGALAMTTPGDTTMARKKEVEAIMGGAGARVQR